MDEYELIRLGMFINEIDNLRVTYGFWLQNAEVFTLNQADPIANIGAGGGNYAVRLLERGIATVEGSAT